MPEMPQLTTPGIVPDANRCNTMISTGRFRQSTYSELDEAVTQRRVYKPTCT